MMREFQFGLVGCGRVSHKHIASLRSVDGVALAAVCDIDPQALQVAKQETAAEAFLRYEEMLEQTDLDAVIIATPSGLHPAQGMMAARKGLHVISEKPMGTRWSEARELVRVCDQNQVKLYVVKQQRYSPTIDSLKRALEAKSLGRIYSVAMNVFWTRPQSYYDMASWRGTWELDGGALMNQAIHWVDILQWLFGPVESVSARTATLARDIEVEDSAVATLRWRSGTLGTLNVSMLAADQNFESSITVLAERGVVRLTGVRCEKVEEWRFPGAAPLEIAGAGEPQDLYGNGHVEFYQDVVAGLRGLGSGPVDGVEGLKSLEIVIAAYRSAQENRSVGLPLAP